MTDSLSIVLEQMPVVAAVILSVVVFARVFSRYAESSNVRTDERMKIVEARHSEERRDQEQRWSTEMIATSVRCHDTTDRSSAALESMAKASSENSRRLEDAIGSLTLEIKANGTLGGSRR